MPPAVPLPCRVDDRTVVAAIVTDPEQQLGGALAADLRAPAPDSAGFALDGAYAHVARQRNAARAWAVGVTTDDPDAGSALVRAALLHVAEHGGGHVTLWRPAATARDDLLAAEAGLRADRAQHRMTVDLPLVETAHIPEGVHLRAFNRARDLDAWLAVNNEAFAGHAEQGGWDAATFDASAAQPWFDPTLLLLAEDATGLAGFDWIKLELAPPGPATGEIHVIGVATRAQGRGLGRVLAVEGLRRAHERGATRGLLYVAADNAPAIRLYERLGFVVESTDRAYVTEVDP